MKYTRSAIGLLTREYRAVLKKCLLINLGLFALGAVSVATPAEAAATYNYVPTGDWGTRNISNETAADTWDSSVVFINKAGVSIGDNSSFTNNKSGLGGAMSIAKQIGEVTLGKNVTFESNTAIYDGGAVGNYGSTIIGSNVSFVGNKSNTNVDGSHVTSDSQPIGGGAISLGVNAVLNLSNGTFTNNETGYDGGAISTRRTLQTGEVTGFNNLGNSLIIGSGSVFSGNKALGYTSDTANGSKKGGNGGAIANTFATAQITGATFSENSAANKGGAIYNHKFINADTAGTDTGLGGVMTIKDTNFTDNTASEQGGAIYNESILSIAADAKDVTFSGNTANNKANDIYNKGNLTLTAAINHYISLAGGITGDAQAKGTVSVGGAGYTKVANTLQNQNVTVAENATLQLDGADLTGTTIDGAGDVKVIGDSEMKGDNAIARDIEIEEGQKLEIINATIDKVPSTDGALKNLAGGTLKIKNSTINVKVNNAGNLISDPTTYNESVTNSGTASFEDDTFNAALDNSSEVNLKHNNINTGYNGVTFSNTSSITGNGIINILSGTTAFNNTANTNTIKLAGGDFSGTINGGTVDMRDGTIQTGDGRTVSAGTNLYVDANLNGTGSMDKVSGKINKINVSNTEYGNAASVELTGNFANDVEVDGFSYYTNKVVADGKITFSDKLVNQTGMENYVRANTIKGIKVGTTAQTPDADNYVVLGTAALRDVTAESSDIESGGTKLATTGAIYSYVRTTTNAVNDTLATVTTKLAEVGHDTNATEGEATGLFAKVNNAISGIDSAVATAAAGKFDSNKLIKLTPGGEYTNPDVGDESVYTSAKADDLFATKTALNAKTSTTIEAVPETTNQYTISDGLENGVSSTFYDKTGVDTLLTGKASKADLNTLSNTVGHASSPAQGEPEQEGYVAPVEATGLFADVEANTAAIATKANAFTLGGGLDYGTGDKASEISVQTGNGLMIDGSGNVALNKVATNSGLDYDNGAVKVAGLTNDHIAENAHIALGKLATTDLNQFDNSTAKFQNETQVATAISNKILLASASPNIYKDVMAQDQYADKAVSAGALKQIALQVGTNMQADQLGWNINVAPDEEDSFASSLTSTFYNGLEGQNKTVIGALNKAGNAIGDMNFASANIEGVKSATDLSTAVRALDTQAKNIADNAVFYTGIDGTDRKSIVLDNYDAILGTDEHGHTYNLAMVSKWNVADFGSSAIHMNLNSKDGVATLNDNQVVLTDQLLNKVVAADGNIVMTESDVAAADDGIAHKKYTFSTKPALNATSLALTSTGTADAALTMNGTSVNSIDQVAGAAAGNNVLASKATVNKAVTDSILMANASPNIYKDVMADGKYADKAVSAGALKQIALQVGTNMKADQLGWNINVAPDEEDSFASSLTSTFYNGLEGQNKTVIGALNKAGNAIGDMNFASANIEGVKSATDLSTAVRALDTQAKNIADNAVFYTGIDGTDRKSIVLDNYDAILGTDEHGHTYNLAMVSKWNVADFGSSAIHMNLNSKDGVATLNDNQVVLTDQLLNKVVAADGNIVMTESDVAAADDGIAHKKYTFSTKPALNATSLALTSTGTADAALTMNGTSVNSIDQVAGASEGNNVLASKATVNKAVANITEGVTNMYNKGHNWAEYVLGVDVDADRETQLQTALNKLGASAEQGGDGKGNNIAADNIAGALHELDVEKFATANIVTTTNNLAPTDATVYSAAKADAVIDGKISNSILAANPADTKYMKTVLGNLGTLGGKAISAGAFAQFAQEIGFNMKQDQLGWDINVDTSNANSFSEKLNSAMYNGLTKKTTERTVVSALNTVGNAFEDKLDGETVIGKKTVVESIQDALSDPEQDITADEITANSVDTQSLKVAVPAEEEGEDDNVIFEAKAGATADDPNVINLNGKTTVEGGLNVDSITMGEKTVNAISSAMINSENHNASTLATTEAVYAALGKVDHLITEVGGKAKFDGNQGEGYPTLSTFNNNAEGEYRGNLAVGTTVAQDLIELDNVFGMMQDLDETNNLKAYKKATGAGNVAENLTALDSAIGDVDFSDALIADVRAATNATDAILALDGYLHIDTGLWNNISSLKDPDANPRTTATNVGKAIQYLGLYVDSKRLDVANDEKTATIYDDKIDSSNKATFYTTAGAEAKFYAKDEQLDGSQIASGSIAEGSLAEGVVAKLTKATNSVQGIKEGGEDYITLDPTTNKLVIGEIGVDNMEAAAFGAIAENGDKLVKSGVIYSKFAEYKVKDANADEFNVSDAGVLSVKEIAQSKVTGLTDALDSKADATDLDDYMLLSEYTTGAAKDLDGSKLAEKSVAEGALGQTVQDKLAKAASAVQNGDASLTLGTGAGAEELTAAKIAQITTNAGLLAGMGDGKTVVSYVAENAVKGTYNSGAEYAAGTIGKALQGKADAESVISSSKIVQTIAATADAKEDNVASEKAIAKALDGKVNTADVLNSVTAEPADGKIYNAKTVNSELAKKANDADLAAVAKSGKFADLEVEDGAIKTKMIKDGAVTYSKLGSGVQASLDLADSSLQGIANNSEDYITVNGNNKLKVGKIKVSNIDDAAFGDIEANGTKLVKSGTIYTYFQNYAKLGGAANFSSLTLGTGTGLTEAKAISSGAKVAAATALTDADYQTLATNATVRSTVDDAISSAINGIDGADHTWTGNNIFKDVVRFDKGINVAEEDLTVAKGDINVTKGDIVVAEGTVQTGSLTLNGDEVTAIDTDGTTITTADGSASTLATTSTVMKSAQNAEFSAGTGETLPTSVGTAGTIHAAIVNVATAVDTLGDKVGTVTFKDADGNPTTNNIAATTTDLTSAVTQLDQAIGNIGSITADYAKTIDTTTGDKSNPADIATAIQNVATAAAAADGNLNFTEAYTTSDGQAVTDTNKATNLTDAINNVARNAAAAAAGISAEIHGTGTEIAPAGEVKVGNLAATTTVGTVDSNNKLTGMKVSSTATVDTDEDGTADSKALNIAVSGDGRSTNIDMTETEASMTATNNGRTVGMLVTNDGSDTHTVSLGEDGKYVIEIDTDAKTTQFGKGDGKEVVIGEGTILADKSVMVGDPAGKVTAMYDTGIVAKENDNNQSTLGSTGLWVKKGSDEAGVSGTGMWASDGTKTANVSKTGLWVGEGTNSVSVGSTGVYVTDGTDHSHMGPAGIYTTKDVTAAGYVSGKEVVANEGFTLAGTRVTAIDTGATPVTGDGSAETLATTATVMASAENAKYTNNGTGVVKAKNVATLHDAIQVLDNAMGTMDLSSSTTKTFEKTAATDTEPATFIDNATEALLAIDTVVGNVKALDGTAKGNLDGANKSVAEHLSALDKRLGGIKDLGTNSTLAHTNLATTASTAEDGITASDHFNSLDVAMGDRTNYKNNSGSNGYVATNDGSKDLTTMISEVASNIGQFKEEYSTNLISSGNTVNANLSALDGAIGNMTFAEDITANDLTSVINNVDAKLNHSNEVFSKAINQLDYNYRELRHDFEAGMASQAALSALVPNGRAKGDTQLSVGTGMYKGHTAAAVGGFHWFTDNLLFNAGVAWDNAEATGRMGVTYSW